MNTADMAEELAHRQADRWGNRPLTRGPDPDRVAHHLAVAEGPPVPETLTPPAERDGFTNESPIRAFTDFQVNGVYAIGKGFRPSLSHLAAYLDAMHRREGWKLVQIILPDNDAGDPAILFLKVAPMLTLDVPPPPDLYEKIAASIDAGGERTVGVSPALGMPYGDDPINPAHYDGSACADIGELLSANAYQVLKYCWRLGKKDDPVVELGKAIWYVRREVRLIRDSGTRVAYIPHKDPWFEERIKDRSAFTQSIARGLWQGYKVGMREKAMQAIGQALRTEKARIEAGPGSAL